MLAFTGIAPLTLTLSPEGRGDTGGSAGEGFISATSRDVGAPLTLALSPEGRGDDGGTSGARAEPNASLPASPRPLGERARVRGQKAQPTQVARARSLRTTMTEAENRLWYHLRDRRLAGFKFVRQYPIGRYYADFACREAMLVVEADGGQHEPRRDGPRDHAIKAAGYTVLRFWNHDILKSTPTVLAMISQTLASCVPSPRRGEGAGAGSIHDDQTYE